MTLDDAEALVAAPARNRGTAAGLLNFSRLRSEAVVVGAHAAVMTSCVGRTSPTGGSHTRSQQARSITPTRHHLESPHEARGHGYLPTAEGKEDRNARGCGH
jgi:hypothetical protein